MTELIRSIANVGFPIVVAVYLLIVFGAKIDRLSEAIDNLSGFVESLKR